MIHLIDKDQVNRFCTLVLIVIFLLYSFFPYIVEKSIYVNELFSLLGLLVLFYKSVGRQGPVNSLFHIGYAALLFTLLAHFLISGLVKQVDLYGFMRNSQLLYSMMSFFLFLYLYPCVRDLFQNSRGRSIAYLLFITILIGWILIPGPAYGLLGFLSLVVLRYFRLRFFYLSTVLLFAGYWLSFGEVHGLTPAVYMAVALGLITLLEYRAYGLVKTAFVIYLLVFVVIIYCFSGYVDDLYRIGIEGVIVDLTEEYGIADGNAVWRGLLWSVLYKQQFLSSLFGIGFGTSLFPEGLERVMSLAQDVDPNYMYTVGAHNSFITLMVRGGFTAIIAMVMLVIAVLAMLLHRHATIKPEYKCFFYAVFLGFVGCFVQASFNVVIESPIYSSAFWASVAFCYAVYNDPKIYQGCCQGRASL